MTFWNEFGTGFVIGFTMIPKWVYHKVYKVDQVLDKSIDASGKAVDSVGDMSVALGNLLSGKSNTLLYIGLGIAGIVIVPVLLEKFL